MIKNYYEILEVNKKASREIIEKAYRVLIKKYHPDLYEGEKKEYATQKTREINEAYKVLSDEFLREQYNAELQRQIEQERQNRYNKFYAKSENSDYKKTETNESDKNYKAGEFASIVKLTMHMFGNIPRWKDIKSVNKKDIIAAVLTFAIVIILGIVLWFIPVTNGFIRSLIPW